MKKTIRLLSLVLGLCILSSCASVKKTNRHINGLLTTSPIFEHGFSGLVIYEPVKHKMLYDHNGDKYFTPASNTKLFTYYTGLMTLGDSIPGLKYYTTADSLIFKGTGDPSLLNSDLPDSKVLQFLKDAKQKLFYLPPNYQEAYYGPGWSWDDYNSYYSVERGAFPIYANRVGITQPEGAKLPKAYPPYFQQNLLLDSLKTTGSNRLERSKDFNEFAVPMIARDTNFYQEIPIKYSPELFVELLSDTLKKKVTLIDKVPESFTVARTLFSISTDSLYKQMLTVSDNFIAEQILLMVADKVSDTLKTSIAIDFMQDHLLASLPDKPIWRDGSGLSRYNLFTPRTMVRLLEKIKNKVPYEKLFTLLPNGGKTGTLKSYYAGENGEPYIFAKTGTLSNNHSLSGFLKTKSGKILIFSFMNSNYTISNNDLKMGMQEILEMIRDKY